MKVRPTDLIAASVLLAFALVWSVAVYQTVPASTDAIGPRDFPLMLGIVLILMSTFLLLRTLGSGQTRVDEAGEDDATGNVEYKDGGRFAIGIFVLIIVYGFLVERTGFLLATPIVVIGAVAGLLRIRNPTVILALAFGITAGCWLVFNEMLGIYMPPGSWVSFYI